MGAPLQPAATLSFAQRPRPGSQLTAQLSTSPGPPGPLLAPHHLTVTGFPRRLGGESGSGTSHMEKPETLLALERAEITAKHKCGPVGATAAGTVMFQAGIPAKAEKAEPSQGSCVASAPRASASAAAAPTQRGWLLSRRCAGGSTKESPHRCKVRGHGFKPWSRKIPHAVEQLSACATATEPAL
ncbi:uncharacterized protein [Delphinus delphis]|uniref:uncharacterized protein isoform X1 n=1 Tax=Delphinus delphis TaxID=9728 RepID=UPI0037538A30